MKTAGLFVTGTDTGVGKTSVTAMIARQLRAEGVRVGAYKPCVSGSVPGADGAPMWRDVEELRQAIGGGFPCDRICPQRFRVGVAPPVAARREGRRVDSRLMREGAAWWDGRVDVLLVEGVGGLLCPLTETETVADLARDLCHPLLVVSRLGLGTINHTLLTLEAAHSRHLTVAGIVLNEVEQSDDNSAAETNPGEIALRTNVPILGLVSHNRFDGLLQNGQPIRVDWKRLAEGKPLIN